jgi:hypothetical protein
MERAMTVYDIIRKHRDIGNMEEPQFAKAHKCHDWRNYIPDDVRAVWKSMTFESRIMAYLVAERQAKFENWD